MQAGWRIIAHTCLIVCAVTGAWAQSNPDDVPVERGVPILPGTGLLLPGQQSVRPVPPVLIEPADGVAITAPEGGAAAVQFKWQPGSPTGPVTSYRVCVFEATKSCQDPGSESYSVGAQAVILSPPSGLPIAKFLGKSLKWSVEACVTHTMGTTVPQVSRPGDPLPSQGAPVSIQCSSSPARTLFWILPPPQLAGLGRSGGTDPAVPHYAFYWTPVTGARAYLFCIYDGQMSNCTSRTTLPTYNPNPLIVDVGGPEYRVTYDLPQFRGRQVQWTVAACTHLLPDQVPTSPLPDDLRCTWQRQPTGWSQVDILNPLLPPTINPVADVVRTTLDSPPELKMSWQLNRPQDVRTVKVCIVTARGPGGQTVQPADRARVLSQMSPSACDLHNLADNPNRPRTLSFCTIRRPFISTGDPDRTVFGFAVAACNERNQCWYSTPFAVVRDDFRPFSGQARCD
jgi:hypothetical protein